MRFLRDMDTNFNLEEKWKNILEAKIGILNNIIM